MNLYGKSKGIAESIFVAANAYGHGSHFASVRGGNVWGSRGSVLDQWLTLNPIPVTDLQATRFHLPMPYWLDFCLKAVDTMHGGEIFIPKCDAWSLANLSAAFCEVYRDKEIKIIGARSGDKLHETLVSQYETNRTIDLGWSYVIEPNDDIRRVWNYAPHKGKKISQAIESNTASKMAVDELRSLIVATL